MNKSSEIDGCAYPAALHAHQRTCNEEIGCNPSECQLYISFPQRWEEKRTKIKNVKLPDGSRKLVTELFAFNYQDKNRRSVHPMHPKTRRAKLVVRFKS